MAWRSCSSVPLSRQLKLQVFNMSRISLVAPLVLGAVLSLAGCQYNALMNPAQSEPQLETHSVAQPSALVQCPAECSVKPSVAPLREYVERQEAAVGLQLGAFKEAQGAARLTQRLRTTYPVIFEGRTPIIRAIERDGSKLYRVILGPFSDLKVADAFCSLLREGSDACFVTTFDRVDLRVDRVAQSR